MNDSLTDWWYFFSRYILILSSDIFFQVYSDLIQWNTANHQLTRTLSCNAHSSYTFSWVQLREWMLINPELTTEVILGQSTQRARTHAHTHSHTHTRARAHICRTFTRLCGSSLCTWFSKIVTGYDHTLITVCLDNNKHLCSQVQPRLGQQAPLFTNVA